VPLPDVTAGGATTRERSPPDMTAAPRGHAGRGYAPPGRVARTARPQPRCGRNARAPRGHQARVSVGIVSARPRLPPRGAPALTPTWWCYKLGGRRQYGRPGYQRGRRCQCGRRCQDDTAASTGAAASTVAAINTVTAVSTGASAKTVITAETVCVAADTVAAASVAGAVDRLALVANTGAGVTAAANPSAGTVIDIGDARDANDANDAGDAIDVDAPLAADEANPVGPATSSPPSHVTSTRESGRMGLPAAGSGRRSASEKRTTTRNANANASHQLYVCAPYSTLSFTLLLSCFFVLLLLY